MGLAVVTPLAAGGGNLEIKSPYSAQDFEWADPFGSLGRVPRALEMNVSEIV
jgi:hypothetical protein